MVFDCASVHAPADVISTLTQLKAPPEVLEEFHWSWKLGLFESYEIRTPVRTDARDPLLLGRVGEQRYRLALWGESLTSGADYHAGTAESGSEDTGGKTQGMDGSWWGTLWACPRFTVGVLSPVTQPLGISFLFAFVGFFLAWLPTFLYTPENRQHDFLDRYRC